MKKQLFVMLFALIVAIGVSGAASATNGVNKCCPEKQICKPKCEPIKVWVKPKYCAPVVWKPCYQPVYKPKCFTPVFKPRCCAPPTNGVSG